MAGRIHSQNFSGAAKIWEDFVTHNPALAGEDLPDFDGGSADEFRDEYIRLPYDDVPVSQECRW